MYTERFSRRRLLRTGGATVMLGFAGCSGVLDSEDDIQDTDGDGVIDSEDYAPRDPDVQRKADLQNDDCECPDQEKPTAQPTPTPGAERSVLIDGFESGFPENRWQIRQNESDASGSVVSDRAYQGSHSLRIHIGQTGRGDYGLGHEFDTVVQDGQIFSCWCYPTGTDAKLVYDLRRTNNPSENRVTARLSPFGDVRYSSPRTDGGVVFHDSYQANQWQRLSLELRPSDAAAVVGYERANDGFSASERIQAPRQYDSVRIFAGDYHGNVDVYLDDVAYAPGE